VMAQETTAAARSMLQETQQLSEMVGQFRLGRTASTGAIRRELKKVAPHAFASAAKTPWRPSASADAAKPRPVRAPLKLAANALAAGGSDDGWNEF
jgi:methyl-accepting chemotaxis protein